MTEPDNINELTRLPVDWVGHIFYKKSPRDVDRAAVFEEWIYNGKKKIGVFVDETIQNLETIISDFDLDGVQFHGDESTDYVKTIRDKFDGIVIKAIGVSTAMDLEKTESYDGLVDYFIFDTKSEKKGGSGLVFDWDILDNYQGMTPFLLSGGLSLDGINQIRDFSHPQLRGYDLNSRFESRPGFKNIELIKEFIDEL